MGDPGNTADETEVPTLSAGTKLGKYSVVRLLGAGGMGAVYEATHTEIGKRVAIKVLSPLIAAMPGARQRFLREAQLTSRVHHPHIVDVSDMGTDAGQTYLVMEFLRGEDLAQRLERTGFIGPEELVDIMLPVCSAIVAAHAAGITHRDLKPQNIFLAAGTHRVHPKLLDFGISKGADAVGTMASGTLTATGAMIGTPYYLAPEQILDSKSAGPASDQYALGVILYESLTGKRPFDGDNLFVVFQGIVNGQYARPRERRPEIPPALEEVVLRAMKIDSKSRFATIEDFGRALLPFGSNRTRTVWEEAFAGGPVETPSGVPRPAVAMAPTPLPPSVLMQRPGIGMTPTPPPIAMKSGAPSFPGAMTPTPPPQAQTPPPGSAARPATIAQWSLSPVPRGKLTTDPGIGAPRQSEMRPAAAAPERDFGDDAGFEPTRSGSGVKMAVIGLVVIGVGVAAFLITRGSTSSADNAASPAPAPAAAAPKVEPPAPPPVAPAATAKAPAPSPPPPPTPAPTAEATPPPAAAAPAPAARTADRRAADRSTRRHAPPKAKKASSPGRSSQGGVPVLD